MDRRENNIRIFEDTKRLCTTHKRLIEAVKTSGERQYIVTENEYVDSEDINRYDAPAKVIVSKKRSLEAASAYAGQKICVHNFASATNPGGGVTKGSSAQEEAICRCSTLYFNISEPDMVRDFYQKHRRLLKEGLMDATYNADCIFTPNVAVFKTDTNLTGTDERGTVVFGRCGHLCGAEPEGKLG